MRTLLEERQEQRTIIETIKLEVEELSRSRDVIYRNNVAIAGDDENAYAAYTKIILQNDLIQKDIAIVGGGTLILPRMIGRIPISSCEIFELEPSIAAWSTGKYQLPPMFRVIVGDYKRTMLGAYDLIIFDLADSDLDEPFLRNKLAPNGTLIFPYRSDADVVNERSANNTQPQSK